MYHTAQWDGGHFFGTGFGGSGHHLNLYAQLREVNQNRVKSNEANSFFKIESKWRELLDNNHKVEVTFDAEYSGDSKVPSRVSVVFSIDGNPPKKVDFENTPDTRVEGQPKRKYYDRYPTGAGSGAGSVVAGSVLVQAGGPGEVPPPEDEIRPPETVR
ncbi:DNA/RNA non-specific endonuclease [Nocardiopsis prasina]|uniref:DNA/RNA non-specific endonuclease n=1 Tax=Nocardiopsis prasina TaxID=2015 RepID=UPI0009FF9B3F